MALGSLGLTSLGNARMRALSSPLLSGILIRCTRPRACATGQARRTLLLLLYAMSTVL